MALGWSKITVVAACCLGLAACASSGSPTAVSGTGPSLAFAATSVPAPETAPAAAVASLESEALPPRSDERIGLPLPDTGVRPPEERRHFIEFRARDSYAYGHTIVIFGKLDENGAIVERDGAGLAPVTRGAIPFVLGHVIPVGSVTTTSEEELNDDHEGVTARWRVLLSEDEYAKVVRHIRELQAQSTVWHAALANCNGFAARVALFMGYDGAFTWLPPAAFVATMRARNTDGVNAADVYAGLPTDPVVAAR